MYRMSVLSVELLCRLSVTCHRAGGTGASMAVVFSTREKDMFICGSNKRTEKNGVTAGG